MFTTTFYSFKGGVGRTMALANIAAHLADSGLKILVVDFDLEAPGLKSLFPCAEETPGVLEFIREFDRTQSVPDVREYCYEAPVSNGEGQLWVMPASVDVGDHAQSLAMIDWQGLYKNRNGFLLIEDMKQQWNEYLSIDYVFVDSRTGHTDVEGICTRQLPDALISMFYPNTQNLSGICEVSERVKRYLRGNGDRSISQVYVASNVPNLDDENNVLGRILNQFQESIGYQALDATIHHYPSLELLEDPIFVRSRSKTQLAKEYQDLALRIRMLNAADEVGVKAVLNDELAGRYVPRRAIRSARSVIDKIYQYHTENADVLQLLAQFRERRGEFDEASLLLDRSIELGYTTPDTLLRRAQHKALAGNLDTALNDVREALCKEEIKHPELVKAIQLSHQYGLNALTGLPQSRAILSLDIEDFCHIIEELSISKENLGIAAEAIDCYQDLGEVDEFGILASTKSLVLIGLGRFEEAMRCIKANGRPDKDDSIGKLFNFAMAEWGQNGRAPVDLFHLVRDSATDPGLSGVNYDQCLALTCAIVGEVDTANAYIESALKMQSESYRTELSCWSYLQLSGEALRNELLEVKALVGGAKKTPSFMQKSDLFEFSS